MLIVTGGAGFIGSNTVKELNRRGRTDILVVDNLERAEKFRNLADLTIQDYLDKRDFRARLDAGTFDLKVDFILHNGACSDTMGTDGRYMLENNFGDSKALLNYALSKGIPFVYASSAATYGASRAFVPEPANERPLNVYGYSKLLFDQHVRTLLPHAASPVVGLRYFNVYGPREQHKGRMMSVLHQLLRQLRETGVCRLFDGTDGFGPGGQVRDFVHVGDVIDIGLAFATGPLVKGIFNAGTGKARSFNAIAETLIRHLGQGRIEYIPFPRELEGKYQSFTQADLTTLRQAGYTRPMTELEEGIRLTLEELEA
ncbi:ADP-glyceromanno-heptose 6-epimerase [Mesoterricola sediminis]|uniref:ADP-L-glycero-D-manno-heptose-6-epimerase n=1 Tax=Mesoterricola sediminis TaxID=2927980 RepID=A0AA48HAF3_9BACT|nr:ADP-glyceromanno-heptose 6-epimerase [Mesoterricola sediminis]BDU78853.1 ADP-L-glycero-D-manno-heptose-6-epimerase [Mesoterricola sediminis]